MPWSSNCNVSLFRVAHRTPVSPTQFNINCVLAGVSWHEINTVAMETTNHNQITKEKFQSYIWDNFADSLELLFHRWFHHHSWKFWHISKKMYFLDDVSKIKRIGTNYQKKNIMQYIQDSYLIHTCTRFPQHFYDILVLDGKALSLMLK